MSWVEISFETPQAQAQIWSDKLEALGAASVSFYDAGTTPILEPLPGETTLWHQVKVVGLFSQDDFNETIIHAIQKQLPHTPIQSAVLAEQDWTRTWLEYFKPIQFGEKLWIVPTDASAPEQKDAVIVRLDPGLAFGTGTHPTTALCLGWLDKNPPLNQTVLDYGCGSGILAIGALKLGAAHAFAIDYDPQALIATQENGLRNDIKANQLTVCLPENKPANLKAQTILANILAQPLISLSSVLTEHCTPGGNLVMSGLLVNQIDEVGAAYEPFFDIKDVQVQEEWALLYCIKR
ncbi:MAG: 50S ribosomal protein L11 methyltransferase [Candidatus Berkiella sp.]